MDEPIIEFLKRRLKECGRFRWRLIANAAGVSPKLPEKLVYGMRDNPGVQTIQPLLDYFADVDLGKRELPSGVPAPRVPQPQPEAVDGR